MAKNQLRIYYIDVHAPRSGGGVYLEVFRAGAPGEGFVSRDKSYYKPTPSSLRRVLRAIAKMAGVDERKSKDELLPCPFCGSDAKEDYFEYSDGEWSPVCACSNENCAVSETWMAVEAWNKRDAMPEKANHIAQAEEAERKARTK